MPSRTRTAALFGSVILALMGCKERSDARPLPAPEPPATAALTPPRDDIAAPKKRPSVDEEDAPAKPKRPSSDEAAPTPNAAAPAAEPPSAPSTATATGGSAPTPPAASVPAVAVPSAACLSRCQGAMQGCLSAPVDGGVPGFSNLELCKKAFEACQAACK